MKESEKIDIVLRGLYELRGLGKNASPCDFLPELTFEDEIRISRWLLDQGLAKGDITTDGCHLKIISDGVMYCEEDSQSHPGSPVLAFTFVQNIDSPGSKIQVGVHGQVIYSNTDEILRHIAELKTQITTQETINENMFSEVGSYLDEIAMKVKERKPVPDFFWKWLGRMDDLTSIASKLESLHRMIES